MFRWNIRSFTFSDEYKIIYISRQNIRSFRFSDRISDRLHCHMNTRSFIFSDGHRILTTSLYPKYLSEDFRANMKIVLGLRNPKDTAVSFFYQYKADPHENFALSWTDYIDLFSLGKGNTHTHTHTHTHTQFLRSGFVVCTDIHWGPAGIWYLYNVASKSLWHRLCLNVMCSLEIPYCT